MTAGIFPTKGKRIFQGFWGETSNFCLLTSEMIWASALFSILFNRKVDLGIVFISFFIGALSSYVFSILISQVKLPKNGLRWSILFWYLLTALIWMRWIIFPDATVSIWQVITGPFTSLSHKPYYQSELWQLIFFILVVHRGLALPSSSVNTWRAVRSSQLGLLMFLFYGLTTSWEDFLPNLMPFLFFLFFLLIALCTARLAELSLNYGGKSPAFTRSWLLGSILLALLVVATGSLLGWLTGFVYVEVASTIINFLYYALIVILLVLLSPILLILTVLIPFFSDLIQKMISENLGAQQVQFLQKILQPNLSGNSKTMDFLNRGVTIAILLLILGILAAFIFGYRAYSKRKIHSQEEEIQDLAAVKDYLQRKNKHRPFFQTALDQARQWLASARIRRIYAQLMKFCSELGTARPPSLTPLEFLPQLYSLFPQYTQTSELITYSYMKIRYGEYPENLQEMQRIYEAWEDLKKYAENEIKLLKKRMRQV